MKFRNIMVVCLFFIAIEAEARDIKMLFWYPGEAGSTEEAEGVLDPFFAYINAKIAPDRIRGSYFNSIVGGKNYIAREHPALGIMSFSIWIRIARQFPKGHPWLAIAPLPHGKANETYVLMGRQKEIPRGAIIFSSEPLGLQFIRKYLFPLLPDDVRAEDTPQLLLKLKQISAGEERSFAILTPAESETLTTLNLQWAKELVKIETSPPVPTARVILFEGPFPQAEKLKEILLGMHQDPAAAEILAELRLKGFVAIP